MKKLDRGDPKCLGMTATRTAKLEALGFVWAPVTIKGRPNYNMTNHDKKWEGFLARLAGYKAEHGDCNVPQDWAEDPGLGKWVDAQRARRKQLDFGDHRGMTAARVAKLEALGFAWVAPPTLRLVPSDGHVDALPNQVRIFDLLKKLEATADQNPSLQIFPEVPRPDLLHEIPTAMLGTTSSEGASIVVAVAAVPPASEQIEEKVMLKVQPGMSKTRMNMLAAGARAAKRHSGSSSNKDAVVIVFASPADIRNKITSNTSVYVMQAQLDRGALMTLGELEQHLPVLCWQEKTDCCVITLNLRGEAHGMSKKKAKQCKHGPFVGKFKVFKGKPFGDHADHVVGVAAGTLITILAYLLASDDSNPTSERPSLQEGLQYLQAAFFEINDVARQTMVPALLNFYRADLTVECVLGVPGGGHPRQFSVARPEFFQQALGFQPQSSPAVGADPGHCAKRRGDRVCGSRREVCRLRCVLR
jgi:hypothetical protein